MYCLLYTAVPKEMEVTCKVESGLDDPDYLGHFLVGQVGVIHKINYLDVIRIFNRSHVV